MEIEETILNKINRLARIIVEDLETESAVLINIQIDEEYAQYDVLFSISPIDIGSHQRGIRRDDLFIGIIGHGCYGFNINIADTDPGYYAEKLGVRSNFLAFLFNAVREKLKELQ